MSVYDDFNDVKLISYLSTSFSAYLVSKGAAVKVSKYLLGNVDIVANQDAIALYVPPVEYNYNTNPANYAEVKIPFDIIITIKAADDALMLSYMNYLRDFAKTDSYFSNFLISNMSTYRGIDSVSTPYRIIKLSMIAAYID